MRDRLLADAGQLPTIAAGPVALRWITTEDVPALFVVFGDAEVCRYWSRPALADIAAAAALQQEIHALFSARMLFQWGVVEQGTGSLVGTCTLASLDTTHDRAEVGFALRREVWGRGYATAAVAALVAFAFTTLGLRRLEADADPRNAASIRVLERVGFRREGLQRERYVLAGEVQDALIFGLLRGEWSGEPPG